ncbi:alpha-amylase family glycosyl hydrolase [Alishewanella sp. d11]|uniref:alpha-amylase family glycosyl hydrolase n=1 Tax=Alishewanella sp. d11 TaxID=3414030 RepID=UPI003BF8D29B
MNKILIGVVIFVIFLSGCQPITTSNNATALLAPAKVTDVQPYVTLTHPAWTKDAVIYQLNTRQFSKEGTFNAAKLELPRLKALGVDIIWLMPIHPIGEVNRKGSLGSPYAVKDYLAVNPEFGTKEDFKAFVDEAHRLGLYVILDWVANHTAWDNVLVAQHPDWYLRDWKGDFRPTPWWDWSDIIELDYSQPAMRQYMAAAMRYWVEEFGVDGYRADVAGFVPLDFWVAVRRELEQVKPVFMLAEFEGRDFHAEAFDATYGWTWGSAMHDIALGKKDTHQLYVYYSWNERYYPQQVMRLLGVSNHDANSWEGTEFERFGAMLPAAMVLSFVSEGIPMIYNGQEAGYDKRLEFFERDPIVWQPHENGELYKQLIQLKKSYSPLWNSTWGARMIPVHNSAERKVLSFVRQNQEQAVFAVFNFTAEPQEVSFDLHLHHGNFTEFFTQQAITFSADTKLVLPAWGYQIFVR